MKKRNYLPLFSILAIVLAVTGLVMTSIIVDKTKAWHDSDFVIVNVNGHNMTLQEAINHNTLCGQPTQNYTSELPSGHDAREIWVSVDGDEMTLQDAIDSKNLLGTTSNPYTQYSLSKGHLASDIEVLIKGQNVSLQEAIDLGIVPCSTSSSWQISIPSSAFEFETSDANQYAVQQIDSTHYIVIYSTWTGTNKEGRSAVLQVNPDTGAISRSSYLLFENKYATANSLMKIDDTHYLAVYSYGQTAGIAVVLTVNPSTWAISKSAAFVFDDVAGMTYSAIQQVDSTHYLLTYTRSSNSHIMAVVLQVNPSTWAVTKPSVALDLFANGREHALKKIDSTHYLEVYLGQDSYNYAVVLQVNPSTWAVTKPSSIFTSDASYSTYKYNSLEQIDATHFINTYTRGLDAESDGYAQILQVNPSTWAVSSPSTPFLFSDYATHHALQRIDSSHFLNIYKGFDSATNTKYVEYATVLEVNPSNWAISKPRASYETNIYGIWNVAEKIDSSHFLNIFLGQDSDGYAVVFKVD